MGVPGKALNHSPASLLAHLSGSGLCLMLALRAGLAHGADIVGRWQRQRRDITPS
jgi:hypothetical protein